jgi:hypothetical protein
VQSGILEWNTGTTNEGTALISDAGAILEVNGNFDGSMGSISGIGTLDATGTTVVDGNDTDAIAGLGTIAPGLSSGTLNILGNTVFDTGTTLAIELEGNATAGTDYDQISVTGNVTFTGGTIDVILPGTYTGGDGHTFDILTYTGTASGDPLTAFSITEPAGYTFELQHDTTNKIVRLEMVPDAANAAPTVSLANVVTSLPEDTDTSVDVKMADIVISDDGQGSNNLSLTGPDAVYFKIVGTELYLKAGVELDFEFEETTYEVTVQVDDPTVGGTPDDTALLTGNVTNANDAPMLGIPMESSLSFDGLDGSKVTLPANASLDSAMGTWSVWVRTDGVWGTDGGSVGEAQGTAALVVQTDSNSAGLNLLLNTSGGVTVQANGASHAANFGTPGSAPDLGDNQWHLVTVTYDQALNGEIRIFIDGQLQASANASAAWSLAGQDLLLGDSPDSFWEEFSGELSGLGIWDRKLSEAEVQSLMKRPPDLADANLVSYLPLDDYPDMADSSVEDLFDLNWGTASGGVTSSVSHVPPPEIALDSIQEDNTNSAGNSVSSLVTPHYLDLENDALGGIAVMANSANAATEGAWQYSTDAGATWHEIGTVSDASALMLESTAMLRFVPVGDFNGDPGALTVRAIDTNPGCAHGTGH